MVDVVEFAIRVCAEPDVEPDELAEWTARLRADLLLDPDVLAADPLTGADAPDLTKGISVLVGWLAVRLGWTQAGAVISAAREWATRNGRVIEVSYGGETLKVTGATAEQQEKIIDEWLARHAPRA